VHNYKLKFITTPFQRKIMHEKLDTDEQDYFNLNI
jgi:hypothetical protein